MWLVQAFKSRRGIDDGLNSVCGGLVSTPDGVFTPEPRLGSADASATGCGGSTAIGVGVVGQFVGLERPEGTSRGVEEPDFSALL